MQTQEDKAEKVDMVAVRAMFAAARLFLEAMCAVEDALDESIGDGKVLSVCRTDAECGINTALVNDLAMCLRLGNCLEDSWANN